MTRQKTITGRVFPVTQIEGCKSPGERTRILPSHRVNAPMNYELGPLSGMISTSVLCSSWFIIQMTGIACKGTIFRKKLDPCSVWKFTQTIFITYIRGRKWSLVGNGDFGGSTNNLLRGTLKPATALNRISNWRWRWRRQISNLENTFYIKFCRIV